MVKYIPLNRAYHRAYVLNESSGVQWYGEIKTIRRDALDELSAYLEKHPLPMYWTKGVAHILDKPSYFPTTCFRMVP